MVIRVLLFIGALTLMTGCLYAEQKKACDSFPLVCKQLREEGLVRVIVTIEEFADKTKFATDLGVQGATIHKVFEITPQVSAEINFGHFMYLNKREEFKDIQLDNFNLRSKP